MLSGVLSCPFCEDSPMYRLGSGYYRCTGRGANRRGCGNMVRAGAVDAAVDQIITEYFATPVMAHAIIPGNEAEIAARLEEIRFEIRQLGSADLDDGEYDRRLAGLRAERDRMKNAPRSCPTGWSWPIPASGTASCGRGRRSPSAARGWPGTGSG